MGAFYLGDHASTARAPSQNLRDWLSLNLLEFHPSLAGWFLLNNLLGQKKHSPFRDIS